MMLLCRYEKIAEQEEMANQQQRKRLYQEVQLEKERLTSTFQQKQREMEQHFASIEVTDIVQYGSVLQQLLL